MAEPSLRETVAGIEYMGVSGISKDCQDAILRLIQYGDRITHARILSCCPEGSVRERSLLLTINFGDHVAIKSGFASGYGGEGPRTFSYVLQVLESHGAEIDEIDVASDLFERLEYSTLTPADLETIKASDLRRPNRWFDYVYEEHMNKSREGTLWKDEFPTVVPFAIVYRRIIDLALSFWDDPDKKLMAGYRRLEDTVRKRTGIDQHGSKLFFQAFDPRTGRLMWTDGDDGDRAGKMNLFTGTFQAHRNRRAHQELTETRTDLLSEFLLLNHLFRLEKESVEAK